jgi:hypothetical protein
MQSPEHLMPAVLTARPVFYRATQKTLSIYRYGILRVISHFAAICIAFRKGAQPFLLHFRNFYTRLLSHIINNWPLRQGEQPSGGS